MHIALLGIDEDTLDLVSAALERGQTIGAVYDATSSEVVAIQELSPRIAVSDAWEDLISGEVADAVIVARAANDDRRADQLRKLVQAGVPMIVAHPVHESMLIYYELDMIRQESRCSMLPYTPQRWHPAMERLVDMTDGESSVIGRVEQLVCERFLAGRSKKSEVLTHFVRDVDMLRLLAGELNKVGAMTSPLAAVDYSNLGIQMSGPSGTLVRWSVGPAEPNVSFRLSAVGSLGKLTLIARPHAEAWTIESNVSGKVTTESFSIDDEADSPAAEAIALLADLLSGADVTPTWLDAARDMELADAIDRSIERGRTIDLHFEEQTEQGTFKGMMAAGGCFLLVATLALAIVGALLGGVGAPIVRHWPYVMAVVLGGFLLLQLLRFVFPPARRE